MRSSLERASPPPSLWITRRGASLSEIALASLFFLAATVLFTWPIAPYVADGLADLWDAKFTAWVLHWDYHQTLRDPIHLFDANIFYPARYALAFSENLYGAALFGFPLYAAGLSTLAVYNLVFLLGMFLSGLAAWALAREATGDPLASVVAGVVYAFCPWRIAQIPHIQHQWGAFLALALLFLLRYLDGGRRRDAALFAVCFAWNALCNVHYAIFSGFLVVLVLGYEGLIAGWVAFRPRLAGAVAAMTLAVIVVLPFYVPYALASELYGMRRGSEEIDLFSGVWTDFLASGGQNKLYGPLTQKWVRAEGQFFPGLTVLALAAFALATRRRDEGRPLLRQASPVRRRIGRFLDVSLLLAFGLWIAALAGISAVGPLKMREPSRVAVVVAALLAARLAAAFPGWSRFSDLGDFLRRARIGARAALFALIGGLGILVALGTHTPFYRFLVQSFGPVFRIIRAPSRGIVLFDLGLGVLAAWGLSEILRSRPAWLRVGIAAAAVLLVGFEYRAFPVRVDPVAPAAPPVDRWLAGVEVSGSVIEWPFGIGDEVEYQFRSTAHWKPLVNGYSGFFPPTYLELAAMFDKKAILEKQAIRPDVWEALERRRCRLLVLHPDMITEEPLRRAYLAALRDGLKREKLRPVQAFGHADSTDLVFELSGTGLKLGKPKSGAEASLQAGRALEMLEKELNPPFGFLDSPKEDESIAPGAPGFGWALDDSGIEAVLVAIDGGPPSAALYGMPHPGPPRVYPRYPDAARAGFGFSIPALAPGPHTLTATIKAKDGGKTVLKRNFIVKARK